MKSIKALFVVTVLSVSSLAMAEGGGDRTFVRMEQARQASMEVAARQKDEAPVAVDRKQAKHANC